MNNIVFKLSTLAFIGNAMCISYAQQREHVGKVGINTERPEAILHIKSKNQGFNGDTEILKLESWKKIFSILDKGHVGIGNITPTMPLDVDGGARFKTGSIDPALVLSDMNNETTTVFTQYDGKLDISAGRLSGPTITLKHANSAAVGINMPFHDTTPTATLDINGNLKIRDIKHSGRKTSNVLTTVEGVVKYTPYSVLMSPDIIYVNNDYVIKATDSYIVVDSPNPVTLTINRNIIGQLVDGDVFKVVQKGTGQVTIVGENGVQVYSAKGNKTRRQFSVLEILLMSDASCIISGDVVL